MIELRERQVTGECPVCHNVYLVHYSLVEVKDYAPGLKACHLIDDHHSCMHCGHIFKKSALNRIYAH
jgi:5-methylcytosine-specific restriction endonuclease McrA